MTVGSDNKPVVVGTGSFGSGASFQSAIAVDRFMPVDTANPVFQPDATWGGTGLVKIAYNAPSSLDSTSVGDLGFSVRELGNGNVVVGGVSVNPGTTTSSFNVTKLIGDGAIAGSVSTITGLTTYDENYNGVRDTNDFGLVYEGAFLDTNNNGVYDAGEVRVYSDETGRYRFNDLTPGTYHVRQNLVAGYAHTVPTSNTLTVTVAVGATSRNNDFGVTGTGSISGNVYSDTNGNGIHDSGEPALVDNIVYLDLNNNGVLDASDTSVGTNTTGAYTFTHLPPLTYRVRVVVASGHTLTSPVSVPVVINLGPSINNFGNVFNIA